MKKYYNVNYRLFALLLSPTSLRKEIMTLLLASFVKPLDAIHNDFTEYMDSLVSRAGPQVCCMQKTLNDEFDYYSRRIRVRTVDINPDDYLLWRGNQNRPVMLPLCLLGRDGRIGANHIDFEVVLPVFFYLTGNEEKKINALVSKNKLASKKYIIKNGQD
jgi:hypothetical protein